MEDPSIESTWNRKRSFDDAINTSLPGFRFCLVTQRSSLFEEVRCVTRRKRLRGRQRRHLIDFRSKRGTFFYQVFSKYISFANKPACSLCPARSLNAWPAGCMSKGPIMPESKCKQKGLVSEFELKIFHLILTPKRHKIECILARSVQTYCFRFYRSYNTFREISFH